MKRHKAATKAAKGGKTPPTPPQQPASEPEPPKVGRPTKLTPERQERIIGAIRGNAPNEIAAAFAGISEQTFYNWINRANEDEKAGRATEFVEFLEAIEKAQAENEIENLLIIRSSAKGQPTAEGVPGTPGTWQAAAWLLERRHPERYGRRIVQIPDPEGGEGGGKKGKGGRDRKPQYFRFGGQVIEF